jgi:phage-related protein
LAQWFKDLWAKIKAIFGAIWDGIKKAYNTYIKPIIETIKNALTKFWDTLVALVNGVIKFFGDIWNWIGEKLC